MPDAYEPRFTTLEAVRLTLRLPSDSEWLTSGKWERLLANQIAAAESEIIEWCDDEFNLADDDASARVLRAYDSILLTPRFAVVPERVELLANRLDTSGVVLSAINWNANLLPERNQAGRDLEGNFYAGSYYRVTARWGWIAVPWQVPEASKLLAARFFARQAAPLGLTSGDVPAYVSRTDTDVRSLLEPYIVIV